MLLNLKIDLDKLKLDPVPRILIGVSGAKHSGKSKIAEFLNQYKQQILIRAFAEPLKAGFGEMFGFNESQIHGELKDSMDDFWGIFPREVYQIGGTEIFRDQISPNFWVARLHKDLNWLTYHSFMGVNVVIQDVRFKNEIKYIVQNGGHIIHVIRPGYEGPKSGVEGHRSEDSLSLPYSELYQYANDEGRYNVIFNDSSLEALCERTIGMYDSIYSSQ